MFLFPLLFAILIIWGFVYLLRVAFPQKPTELNNYNNDHPHAPNLIANKPMEILKERYAKGEISEEEYLKIKRNLE
ncbi:SHOCT domain-containing protein [Geosporobacter ferrireducens]|uniref:SHOCT domain-containing protein n=1 Tax=Geosporobacter ferrireducens TaxID=1424294 RepID=A0A1D8GE17_9FIRM|nr:SHOCT domain-containing protein [Geosporobacter ferrireducens]AOT69153.1 hypothetical protein Gferi_06005 [Geosporobacter ferrireducens]MTI56830.1 SHOCT domain-containing protein [Geosporobacter ferrireducens]